MNSSWIKSLSLLLRYNSAGIHFTDKVNENENELLFQGTQKKGMSG